MKRRSRDWNDDDVRAWHARYFLGSTSISTMAAAENPPIAPAMIYYHFARLGLLLRKGTPPAIESFSPAQKRTLEGGEVIYNVLAEAERTAPVPKRPFAGPPIYRSEFIRGDAERKMRAGR